MRKPRSNLGVLGGPSVLGRGVGSFDDDMAAIVTYMNAAQPRTAKSAQIKDEFAKWYANLGWTDLHWDTDTTYAKARNYRDSFNLADATTSAEKAQVQQVITSGVTTEQASGEPPKARTTSGRLAVPTEPLVKPWQWAVIGVVGLAGIYALGMVTTLAQIFSGKGAKGLKAPKLAHSANPRRRR